MILSKTQSTVWNEVVARATDGDAISRNLVDRSYPVAMKSVGMFFVLYTNHIVNKIDVEQVNIY